jgi:hypothetical protein
MSIRMTEPVVQHPHDMPEAILRRAIAVSNRPDSLRQFVAISRAGVFIEVSERGS